MLHDDAGSLAARVDEIAHAMRFQLDGKCGKRLLNGMAGFFHAKALLNRLEFVRWHGGIKKRCVFAA